MDLRFLGKTGLKVTPLGFGGYEIGTLNPREIDVDAILNAVLDSGINVIDTAAAYFRSEEFIGRALSGRRGEFVLMTKCGALDGFTREDWSKKGVLDSIENSLRLLRTDHLDVVFLHSCSEEILRQADCIEGLIRAKERGMTRFAGYSGDNDAAAFALGLDFFDVLETSVSIADQAAIATNIARAAELGVGVVAKRPVANAAWRYDDEPSESYHVEYWKRLRKLDFPFTRRTTEGAVATAARFVLAVDGVATAIVGSTNIDNIRRNVLNVSAGPLEADEFDSIRARWSEAAADDWVGMT